MIRIFEKYNWRTEWVHPMESAWGLANKFCAANLIDGVNFNKLFRTSSYNPINQMKFDTELGIYIGRTQKYERTLPYEHKFKHLHYAESIINDELYYCPECIKTGFHSVYHQLSFQLECAFHPKIKLIKLCDCKNTYSLNEIGERKLFSCPCCGKQMPVNWDFKTCIVKDWLEEHPLVEDLQIKLKQTEYYFIDFYKIYSPKHIQRKIRTLSPDVLVDTGYGPNMDANQMHHNFYTEDYTMQQYLSKIFLYMFDEDTMKKAFNDVSLNHKVSNEESYPFIYHLLLKYCVGDTVFGYDEVHLKPKFLDTSFIFKESLNYILKNFPEDLQKIIYFNLVREKYSQIQNYIQKQNNQLNLNMNAPDTDVYPIHVIKKKTNNGFKLYTYMQLKD